MQLSKFYEQCELKTKRIPNFIKGKKEDVEYDIDKIANGYCKACDENNELDKDSYMSAFFIRYWHMIFYYKNISSNIEIETILEWLTDGFMKACKYRSWLKDSKLIHNKRGAEICINNAIDTMRKNFYKFSNAKKRKDSFFSDNFVDIDELTEREAEYYLGYEENLNDYLFETQVVNMLLSKKRYLEGVLVDLIMNGSSVANSNFSKVKLSREVRHLDDKYYNYFYNKYDVDNLEDLKEETSDLTSWKLNKSLNKLKNSSEISSLVH